jgi:hypothetical protein
LKKTAGVERILVIEPQCRGFEHASFNAALLYAVRLAFPDSALVFLGDMTHLEFVNQELCRVTDHSSIVFEKVSIPGRGLYGWKRLGVDFVLCKKLLDISTNPNSKAVVFCSVPATFLLSLKLLMAAKKSQIPTIGILHGDLAKLTRPVRKPWYWPISMKRILALPHPGTLRLLALGDSILRNLTELLPRQSGRWSSLDLAYLWPPQNAPSTNSGDVLRRPVRFGFVGVSKKGFNTFVRLAEDVAPAPEEADFSLVGFYDGPANKKPVCQFIPKIPDDPLSREEFERGMSTLRYVVWTATPEDYRFTASATFLDALAFLKPGIYLRNDFVEHYFGRMGDIGYLCDNYAEMLEAVRGIISEFPAERYQRQVENIQRGRAIFQPETLAPQLRDIISACEL